MLLWTGQTVSEVGSSVTTLALPLVAVLVLHATTFEVGALAACTTLPFLVVALPAGAWVDRWRKRTVLLWSDAGRVLVLGSVPVAQAFHRLGLAQLYLVAVLAGVLTVFFDVAYQSYLPALVARDELVEANAKIGASESFGQVVGPSLGGVLVGALGAAYAVAVDAASFAVSAVATFAIRVREPQLPPPAEPRNLRREIREGLSFVLSHPILKKVVGCTATSNFFSGAAFAIEAVFLVRILHASPGVIGLVLSLGSIGGLLGAISAGRIARRVGTARIIWLSLTVTAPFGFLIPFAFRGYGVLLVAGALFAFSAGSVVYNTAQVSFRQAVCPPSLLGRMNASVRFIVWGTMPLGAFAGGALGTVLGLRVTEFLCALGGWAAVLWVINSPLFGMRDIPESEAEAIALGVP
jgi:MFS family permease